jgi:hypothetical protein
MVRQRNGGGFVSDAIRVFAVGISGVFLGMLALYVTIKLISLLAARLPVKDESP